MSSPPTEETITSRSPAETWELAQRVVASLPERAVLALHGQLGSGKTCFVQGIATALKVDQPVTSPSYTLVNEYRTGTRPLYHIDLYRIASPDEVFGFDFEDYLDAEGITAVEWAERAGDIIPPSALHVRFETLAGRDVRRITLWAGHKSQGPDAPNV